MGMNHNCRKKKCFSVCQETKDIGFLLLVFGAVTICAFFLPPKAWLILLGVILIICGCVLMKRWRKKRAVITTALVCFLWLKGTVYFVGSDASCAYVRSSDCTVLISDSYRLNVRVPFSSCTSYGVRNIVSGRLSFSANFTFSWHLPHLL